MVLLYEQILAEFATLLSQDFECNVSRIDIPQFANGEFNIDPICADDNHIFVLFPVTSDINSEFFKYCLMLQNIQDAQIIDIFMPYIPYSRQDKSKSFATVLQMLKGINVRQVFTIDIHKPINDSFIINIMPHELFGDEFINSNMIVVAPDLGARHRTQEFARYINADWCYIDKMSGLLSNKEVVIGKNCLIVDDIVDTGYTLHNAFNILISAGAAEVKYCISSDVRKNLVKYHRQIFKALELHLHCKSSSQLVKNSHICD